MISLVAGCSSNCIPAVRPFARGSAGEPAALAGHRLLGLDLEGNDDDEEASNEGWLQRRMEGSMLRWVWQNHYFRLESGPKLLSFYASHIWQGCRRDGAYDLTRLVGVRTRVRRDGQNAALVLEFSNTLAAVHSVLENVEVVELRVPDGWEAARRWEDHFLRCIEEVLLRACEQCGAYDGFADSAARILARVQVALVEGRPHVDVNVPRQAGTSATLLMLAAQAGHERVCTHLLMARADPTLQNPEGLTAADLATQAAHHKVAALLTCDVEPAPQQIVPQPTLLGVSHDEGVPTEPPVVAPAPST